MICWMWTSSGERVRVSTRPDSPPEGFKRMGEMAALVELQHWLHAPNGGARSGLLDLYRAVIGHDPFMPRTASERELEAYVLPVLERSFRQGKLVAHVEPRVSYRLPPAARAEAAPASVEDEPAKKDWIELVLVPPDGPPIAAQRYRLELADGSVREGMLPPTGVLRIAELPPGNCKLSFPELSAAPVANG